MKSDSSVKLFLIALLAVSFSLGGPALASVEATSASQASQEGRVLLPSLRVLLSPSLVTRGEREPGAPELVTASFSATESDASTSALAESSASSAPDAAEVTAHIQRTYEAMEDFRAEFVQTWENPVLGDSRRSEGRVFFRKPGMMRWDYRTPSERFIISDGRTLWVYEPEFAQYYTQSLADSQLPLALRFLMGEGQLEEAFEISVRSVRADGLISLRLVPRESEAQLRELRFLVNPDGWEVVETTVIDPLGHVNRIAFSGVRRNTGLPASGFRFEAPEGAHRVSAPSE